MTARIRAMTEMECLTNEEKNDYTITFLFDMTGRESRGLKHLVQSNGCALFWSERHFFLCGWLDKVNGICNTEHRIL